MAPTYIPIASTTLSTTAASVTFSSIPATYTDLVIRFSGRVDRSSTPGYLNMTFNSATSGYSDTMLNGDGSAVSSIRNTGLTSFQIYYAMNGDTSTANTFGNTEIYIPNYSASIAKPVSTFAVVENNATLGYLDAAASLFNSTAAITSITLREVQAGRVWLANSTFHLYGISNT